jgi:peptide/nickel transport system ATP-binding protein
MLTLDRVSKTYKVGTFGGRDLPAVRDVSFELRVGEVVSLIGESGSGKSTIGKMILGLVAATSGTISLDGRDISGFRRRELKDYYRHVQGVFQDPFSSYNPIFKIDRVFDMVRAGLYPHVGAKEWSAKVDRALEAVALDRGQVLGKYPHQLSGGQLQRILVARALVLDIRYLVADEVISMLDASTRVDVLNLLGDLRTRGLGVLFVTHDLSLGHYISDRTVILRQGAVVESGPTEKVFADPRHPYTQLLLGSVPRLGQRWANGGPRALPARGPETLVEVAPDHFAAVERRPEG